MNRLHFFISRCLPTLVPCFSLLHLFKPERRRCIACSRMLWWLQMVSRLHEVVLSNGAPKWQAIESRVLEWLESLCFMLGSPVASEPPAPSSWPVPEHGHQVCERWDMVRLCLQMGKHDELSTPLGTHEPKHSTLKPSQTLAMLLPFQINCKAYSGLKVAIHGTAWLWWLPVGGSIACLTLDRQSCKKLESNVAYWPERFESKVENAKNHSRWDVFDWFGKQDWNGSKFEMTVCETSTKAMIGILCMKRHS